MINQYPIGMWTNNWVCSLYQNRISSLYLLPIFTYLHMSVDFSIERISLEIFLSNPTFSSQVWGLF